VWVVRSSGLTLSIVAATLAVVAVPTVASAHGTVPFTNTNVIHGCRGALGILRQITSGNCVGGEVIVHWDIVGPDGAVGPQGATGPQGPIGLTGEAGAPGVTDVYQNIGGFSLGLPALSGHPACCYTTLASLVLPAGSYVLTGKVMAYPINIDIGSFSSIAHLSCALDYEGNPSNNSDFQYDYADTVLAWPIGYHAELSLNHAVTLPTAQTIVVKCFAGEPNSVVIKRAKLIAMSVGAVH
jgi:hypothetical protein